MTQVTKSNDSSIHYLAEVQEAAVPEGVRVRTKGASTIPSRLRIEWSRLSDPIDLIYS